MNSIIIPPEVFAEIEVSANFYRTQNPGLEILFLNEIEKALMKIQENPEMVPLIELNIRKFVVQKFPFTIFYEKYPQEILILAVGHHKRKPNYWENRR